MKVAARVFTRVFAFALIIPAFAQNARTSDQSASAAGTSDTVKYNGGTYEFRLLQPSLGQVLKDGKLVGVIIPDGKGGERLRGATQGEAAPDVVAAYGLHRNNAAGLSAASQSTEAPVEAACPASVTFNYFDGTAWKPMTMAQDIPGKKHGVNILNGVKHPLDPMAQHTNIRRYKGVAAPLTLGPSPRFCLRLSPGYNLNSIVVASLDVKSDDREIESLVRSDSWIPEKHVRPIETKRISDTIVEITPSKPLAPGQYILNGPLGVYDFGVEVRK